MKRITVKKDNYCKFVAFFTFLMIVLYTWFDWIPYFGIAALITFEILFQCED